MELDVSLFSIFRLIHIVAGFAALLVFWIPIVVRKGGKTHTRVGWVYVYSMYLVAISALFMGLWRIILDPKRTNETTAFAYFLIFIAVLSFSAAWFGIRILRHKHRKGKHNKWIDLLIPLLLVVSGFGTCIYGWVIHFPLLQWFPWVGILLGFNQLYYWLNPPQKKMHWWFEHLGSILGCCIATITAFTVFGAPRILGVNNVHPLLWFLPTIVITPLILFYSAYYRKKFQA